MTLGWHTRTALTAVKLTYLLTYSIQHRPSWEANQFSASQEISHIVRKPAVHYRIHNSPPPVPIPSQLDPVHTTKSHFLQTHHVPFASHSSSQIIIPAPRLMFMIPNKTNFHSEVFSTPRPTPKLEDHPLSAVRDLCSVYSRLPSILEAVTPSATWGCAMPWWQGPTYHRLPLW